jgi:hypothetical protein
MRFLEKPLLNTHYYLKPDAKITYSRPPHFTITPEIVSYMLFHEHSSYYTPQKEWLIQIDHSQEALVGNSPFRKVLTYVLLPNRELLLINQVDWFKKHWNTPFLVTNPLYMYEDKLYIFSNRDGKAVQIDGSHSTINQILATGGFSIGNGLIMALSLVATGEWKERDFFQAMEQLDSNNHLYHTFPNHWTNHLLNNPCHPADHPGKFAFLYNSPRLYTYLFKLTQEDPFLYHMPNRQITSVTSLATRKDQIEFAKQYDVYYVPAVITPRPDLYHHLQMKDFGFVAYIIQVTLVPFNNVLFVLSDLYKRKRSLRRQLTHLWRYLLNIYQPRWCDFLYDYLVDQIIAYDKGSLYPCLPKKLIRDSIHKVSFHYEDMWNTLFKYMDSTFRTRYGRFFERKKIHRLKMLKNMTETHPGGHIIADIMKDFYRSYPEQLTGIVRRGL